MLLRGGSDELLEADLDDFERGVGLGHQRAVGVRFAVELVIRPEDLFTIRETGVTG